MQHNITIRLASFMAAVLLASAAAAASQDIMLNFSSLPSAQGFTYTPSGMHAGAVEGNVFSGAGGALPQNTIGQGYGSTGGGILYVRPGIITAAEASELYVNARCLQVEGSGIGAAGQMGFCFGITTGSAQYAVSLTPTQVFVIAPSGSVAVAGTYDNTAFHDWQLSYAPPSTFHVYRDGVLIHTGTAGGAVAANRLFLGDGTGGANAHVEVRAFHFLQGAAVPAEASSWGGVKALFR